MAARSHDASPIGAEEADRLLAPFEHARGLGLAVSGGADSVALMRLLAAWLGRRNLSLPVKVFTVDHGLRAESSAEAASVARWAQEAGLLHETLAWTEPKPVSNVQEAAREARYRLLLAACETNGLSHLLTAHHLDDQAETLLLRLARGSGVDGLAAMAPLSARGGILHARPLLDVPKARLGATLEALGQDWIEDPSNASDRFARVRLRRLMPLLDEEGLDSRRLADTAKRIARARRALESAAVALEAEAATVEPAGYARLRPDPLLAAEEEIALRALSRILMTVGGSARPPRLERLERLWSELHSPEFVGATLGGCDVRRSDGCLVVSREWGRRGLPTLTVPPGSHLLWDNRFRVHNGIGLDVVVAPLDAQAGEIVKRGPLPVPRHVLRTLPAAYVGHRAVAIGGLPQGQEPYGEAVAFQFVELDRRPPFSRMDDATFT